MMSSLGGDKARGPREKALPAATQTSQHQKQIQVSHRNPMNNFRERKITRKSMRRQHPSVHTDYL